MQGKSSYELVAFDGHHPVAGLVGNVSGADLDHSSVGDGCATDIAGQILRRPLCWSAVWCLDIYDPAMSVCLANRCLEGHFGMGRVTANEQLSRSEGRFEGSNDLAANELGHDSRREKVVFSRLHPGLLVKTEPTSGDETMDMWMKGQVTGPGVENGNNAELGAKPLLIGCKLLQGFFCGVEQQTIDDCLIVSGNPSQCPWKSRGDLEVRDGQHLVTASSEPFGTNQSTTLWAVPVCAGVINWGTPPTVLTRHHSAPESAGLTCTEPVEDTALVAGRRV